MKLFNSGYILSNKRHGWIDYDRGISIILVTYRHVFENLENSGINVKAFPILGYINVFLSGFRMPLFFIASGIFVSMSLNKRGLNAYVDNRLRTILYPLLVWGSIQIGLQLLLADYSNSKMSPKAFLDLIIEPRNTGQFWYLNALFFVGILYAFLKVKLRFKLWQHLVLGAILYGSLFYIRLNTELNLGFAMDIMQYYLFFAIGDLAATFILGDNSAKLFASTKMLIPLIIAFIVGQYFFTKINIEHNDTYYVEHHMPFFFLLVALVGCTFSICISFALKKYELVKFIRVVGYNSVHIYCMQIIAMSVARLVMMKVFHIEHALMLLPVMLFCGVFIPMVVYNLSLRMNLWWFFTLKKPEEEIKYMRANK